MVQLVEAADRQASLEKSLDQARGGEEEAWAQFLATLAFSLSLCGFRWVWALLATHFPAIPRVDPIER
jgi:hypothetical protein